MKVKELKVQILGIEGKRVIAKFGRQRKPRSLIAFEADGKIIAQGEDCIFEIDPKNKEAIYNLKGGYFPHLSPLLGAQKGKVPQEFIDALKKVIYEKGDLIGVLPANLGGSPVFFGGCERI